VRVAVGSPAPVVKKNPGSSFPLPGSSCHAATAALVETSEMVFRICEAMA
jgi:hypothetical protein